MMSAMTQRPDEVSFALAQYHRLLAHWRSDEVQNSDTATRLAAWREAMSWKEEAQRQNKEAR